MSSAPDILADAVERALGASAIIRAANPRFGDYQANGVLAEAKFRGEDPQVLAQKIIDQISPELSSVCDRIDKLGPGFINFRLKQTFVEDQITAVALDPRLGVPTAAQPKTVVIDFSSPNVAKPMHVGHVRSTIIGDCLARVLRFLGHKVITDNHLGDWGTQFGMLIIGWKRFRDDEALLRDAIGELERLYKYVNAHEELRAEAKAELVKLQQGDPENQEIWRKIIDLSMREFNKTYQRLGVAFDHTLGESFYIRC